MLCYVWGNVGKTCYESHLRTVNKTCEKLSKPCYESQLRTANKTRKKLKCQTTSMQIVKYEGTQVIQEKPLRFRPAWGLGITLLKLVGSTCPIRSNRVLRVPISRDCFHCSSFRFSHWTGDRNIPGKQPSIECSIEYQPTSDCTKVSYLTTLKRPR